MIMRAMPREVDGRSSRPDTVLSVVVGSLLGDGYVYPNGTLQIDHAWKQREYVEWKYQQLVGIAGKSPRRVERWDKRTERSYVSLRFYTKAIFKQERMAFYADGVKGIPSDIDKWLDPLTVAVWFMDDGGRGGNTRHGMVFNVATFSSKDQELLQGTLKDRYGLETTLQHAGRGTHLYVRAASAVRFVEIVGPHIIPSMLYKLPFDPVTT